MGTADYCGFEVGMAAVRTVEAVGRRPGAGLMAGTTAGRTDIDDAKEFGGLDVDADFELDSGTVVIGMPSHRRVPVVARRHIDLAARVGSLDMDVAPFERNLVVQRVFRTVHNPERV